MAMTMELLAKLEERFKLRLEFTSFERLHTKNPDGSRMDYFRFQLATPYEKVTGSGYYLEEGAAVKDHPVLWDIEEFDCKFAVIAKFPEEWTFEVDEDGGLSGKKGGVYEGTNLFLDISLTSGNVWLTDERLSKYGKDLRNRQLNEKFSNFRGRDKGKLGG